MIGIFRHAKAESEPNEMDRPLTPEGIETAKKTALDLSIQWGAVLTSPAVRAEQTGMIMGEMPPLQITELYCNSEPSKRTIDHLMKVLKPYLEEHSHVLIITHQPLIVPLVRAFGYDEPSLASLSSGRGVIIEKEGIRKA